MNPSCHPSHVANQAKAEKTPCHKHAQALSLTHTHTDMYIHTRVHTSTCAHTCLRAHMCAQTCADAQELARAHPHTYVHARPAPEPRDTGAGTTPGSLGPCPRSRPHWPSLCQARPGGQDPGERVAQLESVAARGQAGDSAAGTQRPCPRPSEVHTWALLPGLWYSLLDSPSSPASSPPATLPPPPRRTEGPPTPASASALCQHRPPCSHSSALSTTSPCPVGPQPPVPNPVPPLGLSPGGSPGSCLCVCGRPSPGVETPGSSVGSVTIE